MVVATKIKSCIAHFSGSQLPGSFALLSGISLKFVHVEQARLVSFASDCLSEFQDQNALFLRVPCIAPECESKIDQEHDAACCDGRDD